MRHYCGEFSSLIQEGKRRRGGDKAEESQALRLAGGRNPHHLLCWGRASLLERPLGSTASLPAPCSLSGPRAGPALSAPRNTETGASCAGAAPSGALGLAARWAYEAAASGPARLTSDVLPNTSLQALVRPPAQSTATAPGRSLPGLRRPRAGKPAGPPCPAPAQEAREAGEAESRPRRGRPSAGQLLRRQAERRAARPVLPEAASPSPSWMGGKTTLPWPPSSGGGRGSSSKAGKATICPAFPEARSSARAGERTPSRARPCHVAPRAPRVPAPTAF